MREICRVVFIGLNLCCFIFLAGKGAGASHGTMWALGAFFVLSGAVVYGFDFLMRRYFQNFLAAFMLGVIAGGLMSQVTCHWISSLSFLAAFLEQFSWKPLIEIFLSFFSVVWMAWASSRENIRTLSVSPGSVRDPSFRRFQVFLILLAAAAFGTLAFSKLQSQWLWQGRPLPDWIADLSRSGYDFQLHFEQSTNMFFLVMWAGLFLLCLLEWFWGRFCLPWAGLILLLCIFAGFLNHLILEIGSGALYQWLSGDGLQLYVLLNSFYLAASWGLHLAVRREWHLPFLRIQVQ